MYESNANQLIYQILMNEKEHLPFEIVVTLPQNNLIESIENDYPKYSLQITKNFIDTLNLKSLNQLYDK